MIKIRISANDITYQFRTDDIPLAIDRLCRRRFGRGVSFLSSGSSEGWNGRTVLRGQFARNAGGGSYNCITPIERLDVYVSEST